MTDVSIPQFLTAVFDLSGGQYAPDGEVIVIAEKKEKGFPARAWSERMARSVIRPRPWYYAIATVTEEAVTRYANRYTTVSRKQEHFAAGYVVLLDDVGTKVQPPPVAPSYRLETSPGNEQWGYLVEPVTDREAFVAAHRALALAGHTDTGGINAVRLARLPGSVNPKNSFTARLLLWEPERVWTLDTLMHEFGVSLEDGRRGVVRHVEHVPRETCHDIPDRVLDWLESRELVLGEEGEGWLKVRCPWHERHTTGDDAAGYKPLDRSFTRGFKCFHDHCSGRDTQGFLKWVADQGGPVAKVTDVLPVLQTDYVLVSDGPGVVPVRPFEDGSWPVMKPAEFNAHVHRMVGKALPYTAFSRSPRTQVASSLTFDPSRAPGLGEDGVFNRFQPLSWPETDEDPAMVLEHLDYLLPSETERAWFLSWLAHMVQHLDQRRVGVVLETPVFGTGRSWLGDLLCEMMNGYGRVVDFGEVLGVGHGAQFNDWMDRSLLVVCEEVLDLVSADERARYRAYEHLKRLIDVKSARDMVVNVKYGLKRRVKLLTSFLFFTNHGDALVLPEHDRRLTVLSCARERQSSAYYGRLWATDRREEARRLWWWLKRRDLTGFDPTVPLDTSGKTRMVELNQSDADRLVEAVLDLLPEPVYCEHLWAQAVRKAAYEEGIELAPHVKSRAIKLLRARTYQTDERVRIKTQTGEIRPRVRVLEGYELADAKTALEANYAALK